MEDDSLLVRCERDKLRAEALCYLITRKKREMWRRYDRLKQRRKWFPYRLTWERI